MTSRWLALAALASVGCTSIAIEDLVFACASDADCAGDTRCHPVTRVCSARSCGDGAVDRGEGCDDGNLTAGDGCDAACGLELGARCEGQPSACAVCGDRAIEMGEGCDDGGLARGDGCDDACAVEPGYTCDARWGCTRCGDGRRGPLEGCDDGGGSTVCVDCRVPIGADCVGEVGERSVCTAIPVVDVAAGQFHTCVVDGAGRVRCAGLDTYSAEDPSFTGQATPPPELPPVAAIAAGYAHTCVVTQGAGDVVCWGADYGILEDVRTVLGQATVPADLPRARDVAAGTLHTCAVLDDDTVRCWGANAERQSTPPAVPARVISLGSYHSCGIRADTSLPFCFGLDDRGRIRPPLEPMETLELGNFHGCGVTTAGVVRCWGADTVPPTRTLPPLGSDFVEVAAGHYFGCARRRDGTLTCWGSPAFNRLGELDAPPGSFSRLEAGMYHACAIRPTGALECWGDKRAFLR